MSVDHRPRGGPDDRRQPHTLARADGPVPRRADDRARHHDRERRAAVDPRRPAASPRPRWSGWSTPTCSPSAASCCSAGGSATCTATAAVPARHHAVHAGVAGLRAGARSQALLIAARAVQGLGGAVVSAVALSLIMNLFTEPAERAKAMGVLRLRLRRRRQHRRAARRPAHRRASLALDLPRQPADRRRGRHRAAASLLPSDRGAGARRATRRGRRGDGHRRR